MIALIIALAATAAYLAFYLAAARVWYQHIRPYDEPLSCKGYHNKGMHDRSCYRQPHSMVDGKGEAASYAMLMGLLGPLFFAGLVMVVLVKGNQKPLQAELEAKIRRLESEDAKWRRDHG